MSAPAELVLYNGRIHAPNGVIQSAIACASGRILALCADDEARSWLGLGGEAVDLGGRLVLPAFHDAHTHFAAFALSRSAVDLKGVTSPTEAARRVGEAARSLAPGAWITGWGWSHDLWGGELPTRALLDQAAPSYPVALSRNDGHGMWVSSEALRRAGITRNTPDPERGAIRRDPTGEPTGVLTERAMDPVEAVIPEPTHAEIVRAIEAALPIAYRAGLGAITCMERLADYRAYRTLRDEGRLGLRVGMCLSAGDFEEEVELIAREGRGDVWLHWTHLKLFADGALNPRTAWMLEPYADDPSNRGIAVTPPDEIRRWSERAAAAGFPLAVHAIGDAANRAVLGALEATRDCWEPLGLRPRIEHVQTLAPSDVPRFAALGIVASMQPIHCTQDLLVADRALGPRADRAYVFRSLADSSATLAFGSDCPVETLDVLAGLYAATTRRRANGYPEGGWYPAQRLTLDEAVRAYTLGAAQAEGEAHRRGSLEPGKLADLVILSRDIFAAAPEALLDTRVDGSIVDGEWKYREI